MPLRVPIDLRERKRFDVVSLRPEVRRDRRRQRSTAAHAGECGGWGLAGGTRRRQHQDERAQNAARAFQLSHVRHWVTLARDHRAHEVSASRMQLQSRLLAADNYRVSQLVDGRLSAGEWRALLPLPGREVVLETLVAVPWLAGSLVAWHFTETSHAGF